MLRTVPIKPTENQTPETLKISFKISVQNRPLTLYGSNFEYTGNDLLSFYLKKHGLADLTNSRY